MLHGRFPGGRCVCVYVCREGLLQLVLIRRIPYDNLREMLLPRSGVQGRENKLPRAWGLGQLIQGIKQQDPKSVCFQIILTISVLRLGLVVPLGDPRRGGKNSRGRNKAQASAPVSVADRA